MSYIPIKHERSDERGKSLYQHIRAWSTVDTLTRPGKDSRGVGWIRVQQKPAERRCLREEVHVLTHRSDEDFLGMLQMYDAMRRRNLTLHVPWIPRRRIRDNNPFHYEREVRISVWIVRTGRSGEEIGSRKWRHEEPRAGVVTAALIGQDVGKLHSNVP